VRKRLLTRDGFRLELAKRARLEMDEDRSGPSVLTILVEEMVVEQEANRLGIRVTKADFDQRYAEIDAQVKERSRGAQTLGDVIQLQKMSMDDFKARLEDQVRKERIASHKDHLGRALPKEDREKIAQIEIVIGQLMQRAVVVKEGLPAGVAATVNRQPITDAMFGAALETRLAETEVRRHLREVCLTILMNEEGLAATDADVEQALELDRPLYDRMRSEALKPEFRQLTYDAFLQMRYGAPVDELRKSPHRRGLFALRQRLYAQAHDADVLKAWQQGATAQYGASFVVTEILLSYEAKNTLASQVQRRTEPEALRLANDYLRRLRGGEPVDAIAKELKQRNDAGDKSILLERRLVYNRGNDLLVYPVLTTLADGAWGELVKDMSTVHVLRRESFRPAPPFEALKEVVKLNLVDQRAQEWIAEHTRDEVQVGK
jgi:hypothetical protein